MRSRLAPLLALLGWGWSWSLLSAGCDTAGTEALTPDAAPAEAAVDAPVDQSLDADPLAPVIRDLLVTPNPNNVLSAVVTFTTSAPAFDQAQVRNVGDGGADNSFGTPRSSAMTTAHTVNVVGMRASSTFDITVMATGAGGHTSTATIGTSTPALPPYLPAMVTVLNDKTRTSPGYTLMSLWVWDGAGGSGQQTIDAPISPLVIVDSDFQIVWYYFLPADQKLGYTHDPRLLPSGDVAFIMGNSAWGEIDIMGNFVQLHTVQSMGLPTLHHDIDPIDGGYLSLSNELREIGGYPGLDAGQTWPIVGDVITRFTPDGSVTNKWSTFDMLPVHYEGNENMFSSNYWNGVYKGVGPTKDWTHGNAIALDPTDPGAMVASSRTLSWIYKFRDDAGKPERIWRLGDKGDFTLTNTGDGWQYGQHAAYVLPDGHVMCFDDGTGRPAPDGGNLGGVNGFSRAVEFSLDTASMQATIVWQYGETNPTLFSAALGSSYVMDYPGGNGNVLIDDGGEVSDRASSFADPTNFEFARIIEVTHDMPPVKVAEFDVKVPTGSYPSDPTFSGYSVYRARRIPSLYP